MRHFHRKHRNKFENLLPSISIEIPFFSNKRETVSLFNSRRTDIILIFFHHCCALALSWAWPALTGFSIHASAYLPSWLRRTILLSKRYSFSEILCNIFCGYYVVMPYFLSCFISNCSILWHLNWTTLKLLITLLLPKGRHSIVDRWMELSF